MPLDVFVPILLEKHFAVLVYDRLDLNIAAPVIGLSLMGRIESRDDVEFADRLLASMRKGFGGHAVVAEGAIDNG